MVVGIRVMVVGIRVMVVGIRVMEVGIRVIFPSSSLCDQATLTFHWDVTYIPIERSKF